MSDVLKRFDEWLNPNGPAALVLREALVPVEGADGVIFPATFAASEDKTFKGGYNVDDLGNGKNVCLVDSVGSQANRIEPLFAQPEYEGLVPRVVVKAGEKEVNLLEAGHRAGDAIVRCSGLKSELQSAFKSLLSGDAEPLAKIAPTSMVFGVWDSRDTQAKLPRLFASTIRAYDVKALHRSAQYVPAVEYEERGLLDKAEDKKAKDAYAERGFVHVPASWSHGGVVATGGIRRDAALHLAALRLLKSGKNAERSTALRRYVLGLALTAITSRVGSYLRQGCNLVPDPGTREFKVVHADGRREDVSVSHQDALEYAREAALAFAVGPSKTVDFDRGLAKKDVTPEEKPKKGK
jgi:CRISPR-associated protein Csb1